MQLLTFFKKISKIGYIVALIALLTRIGYFMTLPFLAVYLTRDGILTPGQIGMVIGISGLAFSITGLFNGIYIDRHSQKNILIVSLILAGLCYFLFSLSMKLFYGLLLVNATLGCSDNCKIISSISLVKNTEKENLSYSYSARFIAINLGLVFGPLIGAIMANQQSLMIFYIAGTIHILVAVMLLLFGKKHLQSQQNTPPNTVVWWKNFGELYKDKILINITFINFLMWTAYSQLDSTMPQYITDLVPNPAILVSQLMIVNAIICVLFQPFVARWAEFNSVKLSGVIGSLLFFSAFMLIAFYPSPTTMLIASGLFSFGELFTLPINSLLIMRIAPKHLIASYNGIFNLGVLGISVGPILGGYGLQFIGSKYLFLAIGLLPIIVMWRYLKSIPD